MATTVHSLSPSQQKALAVLERGLSLGSIVTLWGGEGFGKTTLLRTLHERLGGAYLDFRSFVDAMQSRHPLALEETWERLVMSALQEHAVVLVDDLQLLVSVVSGCGGAYPRSGLLEGAAKNVATYACAAGKKLIIAAEDGAPTSLEVRALGTPLTEFTAEDYRFLCVHFLGEAAAAQVDFTKVHRFASHLSGHELRKAYVWFREQKETLTTDSFIAYLQSQGMSSNVDLSEVQTVELKDIKGCDDVIRSLEANIVLPLERDDLATLLELRPKRGVLLAGPPGTGKTTVGRALAHRLRSKFFLVDGTVISGTAHFYGAVHRIFQAAKENAPSVVFIDDSDVIFESGEELGLYRYLLTLLDGLESESAGGVCVMMTAMDVANIPPALLRSGRIELWLEMSLPNAAARREILVKHLGTATQTMGMPDLDRLAEATEGFTGADLKRLVVDGKNLYAYDRATEAALRDSTSYFLQAVETVLESRARYAAAEAHARAQRARKHQSFGPFPGLHAQMAAE